MRDLTFFDFHTHLSKSTSLKIQVIYSQSPFNIACKSYLISPFIFLSSSLPLQKKYLNIDLCFYWLSFEKEEEVNWNNW